MDALVLATALLRTENIYAIANSIEYAYEYNKRYLENIPIMWTICVDKYNAHPGIEEACNWLMNKFEGKIMVFAIYSGKNGQNNYGGDMFNFPLSKSLTKMKGLYGDDVRTWVYILDDDNIVHPYLFRAFSIISSNNILEHISMIWLTKVRGTGMVDSPYTNFVIDIATKCNKIPANYCPDPSQIIFNYDKIVNKYGEMNGGSDYDYKWYVPVVCKELIDGNILISNESFMRVDSENKPSWNGDKVMASHNCLRSIDEIDDSDEEVMYINISKNLFNESKTYFILNEEIRNKIKSLIKDDLEKLYKH